MLKLISKYSLLFAGVWTAIIFGLCCMPGRYVPSVNWLEILSFDKFVHASIFFCLVCLWLIWFYKINKLSTTAVIMVLSACILYGGLLEVMQATVFSQRSADWLDFVANSFGCFMGFWFFSKKKHIFSDYNN